MPTSSSKEGKQKKDKVKEDAKEQLAETDRDSKGAQAKVFQCTGVVCDHDRGLGSPPSACRLKTGR